MAFDIRLRAIYQRKTATGETLTLLRFGDRDQASLARKHIARSFLCHKPHTQAASVVVKSALDDRLVEMVLTFADSQLALETARKIPA